MFGTVTAVDSVDMEVPAGAVCVLLGPSGCGKTTTMKMINRLIPPTSGKIYIDGQDTSTVDEVTLRRSIGYVIQQIGLFPEQDGRGQHLRRARSPRLGPEEVARPRGGAAHHGQSRPAHLPEALSEGAVRRAAAARRAWCARSPPIRRSS